GGLKEWRVALAVGPPFVMTSRLLEDGTCNTGLRCRNQASAQVGDGSELRCCYGLAVDLMLRVAEDLHVSLQPYLVEDGQFGQPREGRWSGVVGDLVSGRAHASFAPLSVTSPRSRVVDFSIPYFFSSMSILQADIPLLAFLIPFSSDLWVAIFISLNITALAVAIYEWNSPFGLNPWGRQRSKNFSLGSALWVVWGLLFSHLVAFKAPKSWPNKVLINVWGAFSVIFVASYTANIAALFAGLFTAQYRFVQDESLLSQRVGYVRGSSAEFYVRRNKPSLVQHMHQFVVDSFEQGTSKLRIGSLDLLLGDTAILDYLRGTDDSCSLRATTGADLTSDTYAVAMPLGFPFKEAIDALLSEYQSTGFFDSLKSKWYSDLPCYSIAAGMYKPQVR
ncbi:Ionotropic glutamate receptor, partial [Trinorchestia longiramus]